MTNWKPEPGKPAMTRNGLMVDDLRTVHFNGLAGLYSSEYEMAWHPTGNSLRSGEDHPLDLIEPTADALMAEVEKREGL